MGLTTPRTTSDRIFLSEKLFPILWNIKIWDRRQSEGGIRDKHAPRLKSKYIYIRACMHEVNYSKVAASIRGLLETRRPITDVKLRMARGVKVTSASA